MEVVFRRRPAFLVAFSTLLAGSLVAVGCGGNPAAPTEQLQITCPASKTVESLTGDPVSVDFGAPSSVGGVAPVTITCAPANGSSFVSGTTPVLCTARDARQQAASCGLNVTVTVIGTLSATRFMAFGDSITFGTPSGIGCLSASSVMTREMMRRDSELLFRMTSGRAAPPSSYPSVLQGLLASRYVAQSPIVINEGSPGEGITDMGGTNDATLIRLRGRLVINAPEVVLIQEGINDVNGMFHDVQRVEQIAKALHDMIAVVRQQGGARVLLATLLPEDPGGCRGQRGYDLVAPANEQIRLVAASEGVPVVDLYAAFGGVPGPYVPVEDGLHPNELGYEKMAQTFLDAIRANLEH